MHKPTLAGHLLIIFSAVFQAGGLIVVLVEVARKSYLASIVPVIVNSILNEHQIVVDIVAFVSKGDFPRSRLGEKQRGKILATWVTRKMRTMAQFGIRDADSALSDVTETLEPRSAAISLRNGSVVASSLRNVEPAPQIREQEEAEIQRAIDESLNETSLYPPAGFVEMPANNYDDSIQQSSGLEEDVTVKSDDTPTNLFASQFELPAINLSNDDEGFSGSGLGSPLYTPTEEAPTRSPPRVGPKPSLSGSVSPDQLPTVDGRAPTDIYSTLPSQRGSNYRGLKIHNPEPDSDHDDWPQEAIMHMNLAGSGGHSRNASREYK